MDQLYRDASLGERDPQQLRDAAAVEALDHLVTDKRGGRPAPAQAEQLEAGLFVLADILLDEGNTVVR